MIVVICMFISLWGGVENTPALLQDGFDVVAVAHGHPAGGEQHVRARERLVQLPLHRLLHAPTTRDERTGLYSNGPADESFMLALSHVATATSGCYPSPREVRDQHRRGAGTVGGGAERN